MPQESIKVGVIAEETGALSFMGRANANVARMVVDEINTNGGLLGRKIELHLEDGATTDAVATAKAAKLVAQDKVEVIFGGIYSSHSVGHQSRRRLGGEGRSTSTPSNTKCRNATR